MTTPSKRSMERARKVLETERWLLCFNHEDPGTLFDCADCLKPGACEDCECPCHRRLEAVALAFDRLREETIEECAKTADSHSSYVTAERIRLKLKGGEE